MAIKKKDHENLSDSNIRKVIELLEGEKPVTKKVACEILNISYNTVRLNNIIEGFKSKKTTEKRHKAANRGKPASNEEINEMIKLYLRGEPVRDIANRLYRAPSFVKAVLDKVGVPKKVPKEERKEPAILPDACIAETFEKGEIAWSARHHALCEVISEQRDTETVNYAEKYGCKCYRIYVIKPVSEEIPGLPDLTLGGFYGFSPAYHLGSLKHLRDYGFKFDA